MALNVLNIYPKDIHVQLEIGVVELNYILDFLEKCTVNYDKDNLEEQKMVDFVLKKFVPDMDKLTDSLKRGM